jgi:hypothetical protein
MLEIYLPKHTVLIKKPASHFCIGEKRAIPSVISLRER